jgi:hypothetical protein
VFEAEQVESVKQDVSFQAEHEFDRPDIPAIHDVPVKAANHGHPAIMGAVCADGYPLVKRISGNPEIVEELVASRVDREVADVLRGDDVYKGASNVVSWQVTLPRNNITG